MSKRQHRFLRASAFVFRRTSKPSEHQKHVFYFSETFVFEKSHFLPQTHFQVKNYSIFDSTSSPNPFQKLQKSSPETCVKITLFLESKMTPKGTKMDSKWTPNGAEITPKWNQRDPKSLKEDPKEPQETPKRLKEVLGGP